VKKLVQRMAQAGFEPGGPERIDRAHDAIAMLRTVIYFNGALRNADCKCWRASSRRSSSRRAARASRS
jgi:hypothetical protein